ncbi:unnamed protein product [Phytophthora lilii]|uniref:Unnamed protein product n=1 Tax=Phytophthora lilii TaxID=2077276 RepID=A0A9W6XRR0_9STRA|nr:unnamed protein product [Phytophthora lilii]
MLLADSTGAQYAPFLVLKQQPSRVPATAVNKKQHHGFGRGLGPRMLKMQAATGMPIYGNSKCWWNASLSIEFLRFHFGQRETMEDPILLLWDEFSGHWTEEVEACARDLSVLLLKVPGNYTFVCQPADIAWMRPLKLQMRAQWISDMEEQFRKRQASSSKFALKAPKRETVIGWLYASWNALARSTIVGGFQKIGVPSDQRARPPDQNGGFTRSYKM